MNIISVMTQGVKFSILEGEINKGDLVVALRKFNDNDWGILSDEDKEFQNKLLEIKNAKFVERFMGVYKSKDIRFWVMSEYDYSIESLVITILLPEEY